MQYLCQRHHDTDLPTDEFEMFLELGVFRLHDYASSMWLELVEQCCRRSQTLPRHDQTKLLHLLDEKRNNELFDQKAEPDVTAATKFISFETDNPAVYKLLRRAASFQQECSEKGFDKREGK